MQNKKEHKKKRRKKEEEKMCERVILLNKQGRQERSGMERT